MFLFKKKKVKKRIEEIKVRLDVIERTMKYNEARIDPLAITVSRHQYENHVLYEEKIQLLQELSSLEK